MAGDERTENHDATTAETAFPQSPLREPVSEGDFGEIEILPSWRRGRVARITHSAFQARRGRRGSRKPGSPVFAVHVKEPQNPVGAER